ncbi:KilA-N domain-containing protein [Citrobacter braakii]|nr:KilA-N domain-containing protein [Citrobacter braakii]MCK2155615.1 KilA-N domain-containing protein [Citrobacter braakii]
MNTTKNEIAAPVICGVEITTDAEGRFNLNALHKASEQGKSKAPNEWLRLKQTKELIEELESNLLKNNQAGDSRLAPKAVNSVHGGSGHGTFAHELLAIEYAGWISPAFRLQVQQAFYEAGIMSNTAPALGSHVGIATNKDMIDSQALMELVNAARREYGEPAIRNNNFIEKIVDELDGEFYTKSVKPRGTRGGRPIEVINMTYQQSLRVAARESKAVRRSLVNQLQALRENHPPQPTSALASDAVNVQLIQLMQNMAEQNGKQQALNDALLAQMRENYELRIKLAQLNATPLTELEQPQPTTSAGEKALERERDELAAMLGRSKDYATISAVERVIEREFSWHPLRKWCLIHHEEPVYLKKYGCAWPRGAWLAVYRVDLEELFG